MSQPYYNYVLIFLLSFFLLPRLYSRPLFLCPFHIVGLVYHYSLWGSALAQPHMLIQILVIRKLPRLPDFRSFSPFFFFLDRLDRLDQIVSIDSIHSSICLRLGRIPYDSSPSPTHIQRVPRGISLQYSRSAMSQKQQWDWTGRDGTDCRLQVKLQ